MKKVKKTSSLVIASIDNILLISKYKDAQCIALDRSIMHICREYDMVHILKFCDLKSDFYDSDIASIIANKWYRGKYDNDLSTDVFSMGLVLEFRLSEVIANVIRYYSAFKGILEVYDEVIVPDNIPKLLKDILLSFGNRVRFIHSNNDICELFNYPLDFSVVSKVKPHWLSPVAIFLQSCLLKRLKNRVLLFSDWTYKNEKNNSFLFMNSLNITKGYYLGNRFNSSVSLTDDVIYNDDIEINVMKILAKYSKQLDTTLGKLILQTIKREYFLLKDDAVYMYCMYKDLLTKYEPKAIVVYSTLYPWHVMVMDVASKMKIPVVVAQDGISVYATEYEFPNDRSGKRKLVRNYFVMSPLVQKLMANKSLSSINKVKISPPLISYYTNIIKKNKKTNKALVLFNDATFSNLLGEWDYRYNYIVDVVKSVIMGTGTRRIIIKVKKGSENHAKILILRSVLNRHGYNDIAIVGGQLYDHIQSCDLIVGSLGSAMIESIYNNVPYYIFEPYYHGISDKRLYSESILSSQDVVVSRTACELRENIELGKDSFIGKKDLFYDTTMSNINFDNLIC